MKRLKVKPDGFRVELTPKQLRRLDVAARQAQACGLKPALVEAGRELSTVLQGATRGVQTGAPVTVPSVPLSRALRLMEAAR